tara:strand:- start:483 stop:2363 length:1881 start_codon:yes stop_codon:yes gene_type:complete
VIDSLKKTFDFINNMGYKYILFRIFYLIKLRIGWNKIVFPSNPKFRKFIGLSDWQKKDIPFFFKGKNIKGLKKSPKISLKSNFDEIHGGVYTFFGKIKFNLGNDYDWLTNPTNNYNYDIKKHWSEIPNLSEDSGDIKFVWEKARFSFLYDIIRYDYHFEDDQSKFVFNQIENFIDKNPINNGPNYVCSQEISLRILNWSFALNYYKDSDNLTEDIFQKIINSIYWQIHHVYKNINFSRISVRNNHAITETLLLYLSEKLFPFFPNVKKWSKKGKAWFEKEIEYQIYPDGTFLQFSMNYHRVLVQLLTWAIRLSELNDDSFKDIVYQRAEKSLHFLKTCMDKSSGFLPNYGSNDGALFFKLTDNDFRNYKSQIDDLNAVLNGYVEYNSKSPHWYGVVTQNKSLDINSALNKFANGGYYIIQENNTKTFLRCGAYKDRPFQSDNLHLDIWVDGENILRDSGSYKYNTKPKLLNYFNGVEGHNSVSIENKDQMLKGKRFIWNYWVKSSEANLSELDNKYIFTGKINAFRHIGPNISHHRKVSKTKDVNEWIVEDIIDGIENRKIIQYWHFSKDILQKLSISSVDGENKNLSPKIEEKWYSSYYGIKDKSIRLSFESNNNKFITKIIYNK